MCSRLCVRTGVAGAALGSPRGAEVFGAGAQGCAAGRAWGGCTSSPLLLAISNGGGSPSSSESISVSGTKSGFRPGAARDDPRGAHFGPGVVLVAFLVCFAGALVGFGAVAAGLGASDPLALSVGLSAISMARRRSASSQTALDSVVRCALMSAAAWAWAGEGAAFWAVRAPGVCTVACAVLPGVVAVTVVVVVAAARVVPQTGLYPIFSGSRPRSFIMAFICSMRLSFAVSRFSFIAKLVAHLSLFCSYWSHTFQLWPTVPHASHTSRDGSKSPDNLRSLATAAIW